MCARTKKAESHCLGSAPAQPSTIVPLSGEANCRHHQLQSGRRPQHAKDIPTSTTMSSKVTAALRFTERATVAVDGSGGRLGGSSYSSNGQRRHVD